jgi:Raf kinase inhibitor-like YbhB/YbcL family protein
MKALAGIAIFSFLTIGCLAQSDSKPNTMKLSIPEMGADSVLPKEFTGDGAGISPPLSWKKGPEGTKSYAVIMHHIDRDGKTKWYWTLWDIPGDLTSLPKNSTKIGTLGSNEMSRVPGYGPPNSKGPGTKFYTITLYALSDKPKLNVQPYRVNRDVLLEAMKGIILDTSELKVSHSR